MIVTIAEGQIIIEDGPEPDPQFDEDDARDVARLQAFTWAAQQLNTYCQQVLTERSLRTVAAEQANQAINAFRSGLH